MEGYNFEDVMLIPKKCMVDTRDEVDTSVVLGKRTFKIPLMPANMPAVLDENVAIDLAKQGYFYVMHRYNVDIVAFLRRMRDLGLFGSISVGIKEEYFSLIEELKREKLVPEYITIDIAHGHSEQMRTMLEYLRSELGSESFIIAGNVATPEGVRDLEQWGADATKVGIGPGYVCSTSIRTGFGTRNWQLMAIKNCADAATKTVIADGGFRASGDIVKAIHMGADWAMSGYFFAGCMQQPGEAQVKDGVLVKTYYGNASALNKQSNHRVEGISLDMPCEKYLFDRLEEIKQDLQSAVSYSGGTKMYDVRNCEHIFVKRSSH